MKDGVLMIIHIYAKVSLNLLKNEKSLFDEYFRLLGVPIILNLSNFVD
ncbi:hypothetical protein MNB_SUP05-SYMBIONT-5-1187 [hydrothermal vent metagenome]|uniref:Uncharacterized protein n=1 Tax=hydrothermal vent metagenome TaxID=652676 RepID=A0A1W1E0T3_9ZZZZ